MEGGSCRCTASSSSFAPCRIMEDSVALPDLFGACERLDHPRSIGPWIAVLLFISPSPPFCVLRPPPMPKKTWTDEQLKWLEERLPLFKQREKGRKFMEDTMSEFLKVFPAATDCEKLGRVSAFNTLCRTLDTHHICRGFSSGFITVSESLVPPLNLLPPCFPPPNLEKPSPSHVGKHIPSYFARRVLFCMKSCKRSLTFILRQTRIPSTNINVFFHQATI